MEREKYLQDRKQKLEEKINDLKQELENDKISLQETKDKIEMYKRQIKVLEEAKDKKVSNKQKKIDKMNEKINRDKDKNFVDLEDGLDKALKIIIRLALIIGIILIVVTIFIIPMNIINIIVGGIFLLTILTLLVVSLIKYFINHSDDEVTRTIEHKTSSLIQGTRTAIVSGENKLKDKYELKESNYINEYKNKIKELEHTYDELFKTIEDKTKLFNDCEEALEVAIKTLNNYNTDTSDKEEVNSVSLKKI